MTPLRDIWAVVPMKRLADAKQRLAPMLSPDQHMALARAMLHDVLDVLAELHQLPVAVASGDAEIAHIARGKGAAVFTARADDGYAEAATAAGARLASDRRDGMLVLPGDVPGITANELRQLLAGHPPGRAITLVPSRDGGTNAILLTPPDAIPMLFGPGSFARHHDAARRAGIIPQVRSMPGIALDLDAPEDVAAFLRHPAPGRSWALLAALQTGALA